MHALTYRLRLLYIGYFLAGGFSKGENSTGVPDWVDETVAGWIKSTTEAMDAAWGPASTSRGALAFVHIPP